MASLSLVIMAVIILAAFLPPIIYMLIIKNTEQRRREPTRRVFFGFLRGATISVFLAVVIEVLLIYIFFEVDHPLRASDLFGSDPVIQTLILACIIAPVTEEFTKALGIIPSLRRASEIEDGIIYGAAVGLGFAATENLFYESSAYLEGGFAIWAGTTLLRTISSALLHASASSVTGHGLMAKRMFGTSWLPYYLIAVVLHGAFNLAASAGILFEDDLGDLGYLIGLFAAIGLAVGAFVLSRRKIRRLEGRI